MVFILLYSKKKVCYAVTAREEKYAFNYYRNRKKNITLI